MGFETRLGVWEEMEQGELQLRQAIVRRLSVPRSHMSICIFCFLSLEHMWNRLHIRVLRGISHDTP